MPTRPTLIIPKIVIAKPRFRTILLTRKPQIEFSVSAIGLARHLAKG